MSFWWSALSSASVLLLGGSSGTVPAFQYNAFQDAFQGGIASASPAASRYARMLIALLPPGKAWRRVLDDLLSTVLLACADELARLEARAIALLEEVEPDSTTELLAEHEREIDLPSTGTTEERRGRVVARHVARQGFRPADFVSALEPLLGAGAVAIIERTAAEAAAMSDAREIFRFFVYRNPALPGSYFLDSAQSLIDRIKPSHTIGYVIESTDLLCDDPFSLCDRDILGA